MSDVVEKPTPVVTRYYQGKLVGLHITLTVTFEGVDFTKELDWNVPEERQIWADNVNGEILGIEYGHALQESGLRMQLYEMIFNHKTQKDNQSV